MSTKCFCTAGNVCAPSFCLGSINMHFCDIFVQMNDNIVLEAEELQHCIKCKRTEK